MSCLFERSDFVELITATGDENGIGNPGIVEKDYFVTEALRLIARDFGDEDGSVFTRGVQLVTRDQR